jgi:hypothetical protein
MTEPQEPTGETEPGETEPGATGEPTDELELTDERVAQMRELSEHADLVDETEAPQ